MATTIECRPDGPYLVKGLDKVTNSRGEEIAVEATVALCRCGGSASKPFCDGTHKRNGFSGARISDGARDRVREYRAAGITIRDNRSICAHAGACTDGLPAVFRESAQPWIDPAGAPAQAIAALVARCPSGALGCSVEGDAASAAPGPPRVAIEKNGPYAVRGAVELVDAAWARGAAKDRYTLCRCGGSNNKPFCDGSHWERGFTDEKN
jgi:CDGSH-type Zn-finger protein